MSLLFFFLTDTASNGFQMMRPMPKVQKRYRNATIIKPGEAIQNHEKQREVNNPAPPAFKITDQLFDSDSDDAILTDERYAIKLASNIKRSRGLSQQQIESDGLKEQRQRLEYCNKERDRKSGTKNL
jgi:hypothetical protein